MARLPRARGSTGPAIPGRAPRIAADVDRASTKRDFPPLAAAQKRYLRGLAHPLKPVLQVGAKGVSPSLLSELDGALEHHELIKVRVVAADRESRDAWIEALLEGSDAALVQRVGHTVSLYRPRLKDPAIVLPRKS